jgi:hypothetical protein
MAGPGHYRAEARVAAAAARVWKMMLRETSGGRGSRRAGSEVGHFMRSWPQRPNGWLNSGPPRRAGAIERHRATATEGCRNLTTENQVIRARVLTFSQGSDRSLENGLNSCVLGCWLAISHPKALAFYYFCRDGQLFSGFSKKKKQFAPLSYCSSPIFSLNIKN